MSGISVVPLGGKHVNHFWRLLNDLEIPHVTLLDLDREREGGGWGRIKYVLTQLLLYGYDRENILATNNGVLSYDQLDGMHEWDSKDIQTMQTWMDLLERYNVFFSAPLDIDFMMLECFTQEYKQSLSETEGPRITIESDNGKKTAFIKNLEQLGADNAYYNDRINKDVKCTLKECGGDGLSYSYEQRQLMIWYNYFFLNRGKPSTHFSVLSSIQDAILKEKMPPVFARLISRVENMIAGDQHENNET